MPRRPAGTTAAQIGEADQLKQRHHADEVKPHERMGSPDQIGAKGSLTIYAMAEP
jgi:hypothetical protein